MDVELHICHSEMFPYGIRLAQRLGASRILIEPDIVVSGQKHRPDVLGIRNGDNSKRWIVIECEAAHGKIFDKDGPVSRYANNSVLRTIAEFHFILRCKAKYRKERIVEWFGSDATIHDFDELRNREQIELVHLLK